MSRETALPAIWLVQRDERLRAQLAAGLRRDGMTVVEYATAEAALALRNGGKAAALVTQPAGGRLTNRELAEQAWVVAPQLEIIITPGPGRTDEAPTTRPDATGRVGAERRRRRFAAICGPNFTIQQRTVS